MAFWLFQTHPNQYLLSASLAFLTKEPWPVTSHRDDIRVGDLVFFGMVGANEGIYALGRVTQEPTDFEYPSGEVQSFWLDEDVILDNHTWVWVEYVTKIHDEPLMRSQLWPDPVLQSLPIFTEEPGEFNFPLTDEQARHLIALFPTRTGGDKLPDEAKELLG
ncbi:MAG TPA: EVE domain-containing protein [bacterium]|nr:EVE domain-containing protein [bacterium]